MEFNEKLALLRRRKGITQEDLAKQLFVSRTVHWITDIIGAALFSTGALFLYSATLKA